MGGGGGEKQMEEVRKKEEGANLERGAHQRTRGEINAGESQRHNFKKEGDSYFSVKSTTHYHWREGDGRRGVWAVADR